MPRTMTVRLRRRTLVVDGVSRCERDTLCPRAAGLRNGELITTSDTTRQGELRHAN